MRQLDRAKEEVRRAESRAAKLQDRLQDAEHNAGQVRFCATSEPVNAEAGMSCCTQPLVGMLSWQASTVNVGMSALAGVDSPDWASAELNYTTHAAAE